MIKSSPPYPVKSWYERFSNFPYYNIYLLPFLSLLLLLSALFFSISAITTTFITLYYPYIIKYKNTKNGERVFAIYFIHIWAISLKSINIKEIEQKASINKIYDDPPKYVFTYKCLDKDIFKLFCPNF